MADRVSPAEAGPGVGDTPQLASIVHLRCPVCERSFTRTRRHYLKWGERCVCSNRCRQIRSKGESLVQVYCDGCEAYFDRYRSEVNEDGENFCTRDCRSRHRRSIAKTKEDHKETATEYRWNRYQSDRLYREKVKQSAREAWHRSRGNGRDGLTPRESLGLMASYILPDGEWQVEGVRVDRNSFDLPERARCGWVCGCGKESGRRYHSIDNAERAAAKHKETCNG